MDESTLDILEQAAQLHDVGKIGIPDSILLKPGRLTPEEFRRIQKHCNYGRRIIERLPESDPGWLGEHPRIGAEILGSGQSDVLKVAVQVALTHQERWDGTGYPLRLAGEDIPLAGRIVAVADVFDALSSRRPTSRPCRPASASPSWPTVAAATSTPVSWTNSWPGATPW